MKLLSVAVMCALWVTACTGYLGEPGYKSSRVQGARDRYESDVLRSSLGTSAAYHAWVDEGRRALRSGLAIRPSFREIVHFDRNDASAIGYRLELHRGQRLRVRLDRQSFDGRLFAELFEEIGNVDPVYRVVHSADENAREVSFEARTDGVHVLRLQPEIMRGGAIAITLTTAAGLTFPVLGKNARSIGSYFGDPRDGGTRDHEGIDIFAPRGTAVVAVADGVITDVGNTKLGGLVVWQYDPARDVHYYYAHLTTQEVHAGQHVTAGSTVGTVGNTGNARNTPSHLHFAVYRPGRVAINPVPFIFDAPGDPVAPVLVDLTRLGSWTETARATTLHTSPARDARVLAEVPSGTRVRVISGVGEWHRVQLEDGRRGFMSGETSVLGMK
jgi:murein DD-endopeptidase MepM/ murein hydrolase activator NlpD